MFSTLNRSMPCSLSFVVLLGMNQLASAQACNPAQTFKTIEPGYLSLAVTTYPPFSYVDKDGSAKGVDADIAAEIAKRECLKVKSVPVDGGTAIQYVVSGKADIAIGQWIRSAARAKVMGLSAPLYLAQMGIYSKQGFSTISDLPGKTVGTVQGYLWVADLRKLLGPSLKLYPNFVDMLQDLRAGRIDVAIEDYVTGLNAGKKGELDGLQVKVAAPDERVRATESPEQAAFPYVKSATDLGEALDAQIEAMKADGTIVKIIKSYDLDTGLADTGAPHLSE